MYKKHYWRVCYEEKDCFDFRGCFVLRYAGWVWSIKYKFRGVCITFYEPPEPTQEALPDPTATPTSEPEEVTDAKALYDDVFAPIVNHEKWGTSDMLEDTVDNSGYEYKKEKGEPNRYTIYSKSSKKTHVYVSYLERDTGIETPMTVTFVLDGDEIATMGNYSSDGSVGYDKLTVNDTEVQSTSLARSIIFE